MNHTQYIGDFGSISINPSLAKSLQELQELAYLDGRKSGVMDARRKLHTIELGLNGLLMLNYERTGSLDTFEIVNIDE